ncbi:MAG: hypothetical protein HYZ37_19370 [Candidatus Solibacter usitatus]|nr:hypothetical protein [Candidatus Solibacter usitatus]
MKPFRAITAALALLLSFAQAPFAHTHRNDPDHGHATLMPHSHASLLAGLHPVLQGPDDDDDVTSMEWVLLKLSVPQLFVAESSERTFALPPPARQKILRAPEPRAHDPPGLSKLPPRSPPV